MYYYALRIFMHLKIVQMNFVNHQQCERASW